MYVAFIINRRCRQEPAAALLQEAGRYLPGDLLTACCPSTTTQAEEAARQAAAGGADVVVAVGGDGTVHAVVNGIAGTTARLGLLPCGTANDLAAALHAPMELRDVCAAIRSGHLATIDLLRINGRYCATTAGFGIGMECLSLVESLLATSALARSVRRWIYHRLYLVAALAAAGRCHRRPPCLRLDAMGLRPVAVFSLTLSNVGLLGGQFAPSPAASPSDGLFDVCLIPRPSSMAGAVGILRDAMSVRLAGRAGVCQMRSRRLVIQADRPVVWFADGELMPAAQSFAVETVEAGVAVAGVEPLEEAVVPRRNKKRVSAWADSWYPTLSPNGVFSHVQ